MFQIWNFWSALRFWKKMTKNCACRESNPGHKHGRLVWCRYTTCASNISKFGDILEGKICCILSCQWYRKIMDIHRCNTRFKNNYKHRLSRCLCVVRCQRISQTNTQNLWRMLAWDLSSNELILQKNSITKCICSMKWSELIRWFVINSNMTIS